MAYEPAIDVAALEAIDTHVHIEVDDHEHNALPQPLVDAALSGAAHHHGAPLDRCHRFHSTAQRSTA